MVSFKCSSAACLLLACVPVALASPYSALTKRSTHRIRERAGLTIRTYQPRSIYETFGEGVDHPLSKRATPVTPQDAALSFVKGKLGVDSDSLSYRTGYKGGAAHHVYITQKINGIEVSNAVANIAMKEGKVVAYGSSFTKAKSVADATPKLTSAEAISKAEAHFSSRHNGYPTKLNYFVQDTDHVVLAHVVQIQGNDHWYQAYIDAHSGEVVNVVDFVADASYTVVPFTKQSPDDGRVTIVDPANKLASPRGWHSTDTKNTTSTMGNNVYAFKVHGSIYSPARQSSPGLNFNYPLDIAADPVERNDLNAAKVNGFYIGNMVHDLAYNYGFTEDAYNFQANNNPGISGGKGNDAVLLSIQDPSGLNNANFATPPDGQKPHCRMFLFNVTKPDRDGALENDIVTHEFTHGITNRMTGGGTGECLQTVESGGMGEGWSDFVAIWTEQESATVKDMVMGKYVVNSLKGIRAYPYSLSKQVNPTLYSRLNTLDEVHDIGEVWAEILYTVYGAFVKQYGWSADIFDATGGAGNIITLHLVIDALPLQPCNPTFLQARDAIIQADKNRYGGANFCLLWKAFAFRGLGVKAIDTTKFTDSFAVPSGC